MTHLLITQSSPEKLITKKSKKTKKMEKLKNINEINHVTLKPFLNKPAQFYAFLFHFLGSMTDLFIYRYLDSKLYNNGNIVNIAE